MRLILNNIDIPVEQYTGNKSATVDIVTSDENGRRIKNVSQEFELSGAAYEMVKAVFIDVDGRASHMNVEIYEDSCCDDGLLLFEGILTSDGISWCGDDETDCKVNCVFEERTEESIAMDCLKTKFIYDNQFGFKQRRHPRMAYCVEMRPDFLQWVILSLGVIVSLILFILTPVVGIIQGILSFIDFLIGILNSIPLLGINISCDICNGFDNDDATNLLQEYRTMRDRVNQRIISCGRKHISPLVRDYAKNICEVCGLQFSSSIYNNPSSDYYNSVYYFAPFKKGTRDENLLWIEENQPELVGTAFFEQIIAPVNGEYKLIGNIIHVERHDFFDNGQSLENYSDLKTNGLILEDICYEYDSAEKPAYLVAKYSPDAVDVVGNEAHQIYNDTIEWNIPVNLTQTGNREINLPFSPARFSDDGIDEDIYGAFHGAPFGLGTAIQNNRSVIINEKHLAFNPKLLVWDGDIDYGRVRRFSAPGFGLMNDEVYNFPYLFNEYNSQSNMGYPTTHPNSGLYPRFFSIDNPKLLNSKGLRFSFSYSYRCQQLTRALDGYDHIQTPKGLGKIDNISVNLRDKSITISGLV